MSDNKRNLLGKRLMILREEAGLTQEKLAEIFHTKKRLLAVMKLEQESPSLTL